MNTLVQTTETPAKVRQPRVSLWSLRIVATVNLVLVLLQPVFAGLFLTGDVDAIDLHSTTATVVVFVELALVGVAVGYLVARGRRWVLPATVVLLAAAVLQAFLGYTRTLAFHVPLGVAIVTASVFLGIWVWMPAAARPRDGAR
ncbi:hypothetical protein [Actinophytocola oryzae]|uniref:hypothetical protein n=1 Tax=Actinophytocola oryzae TaxID=502181 RepID=UPI00106411B8|nr:hypothetical protein [Actinophytocola oryzae]